MPKRNDNVACRLLIAACSLLAVPGIARAADLPAGYPAEYARLIEAAEKEGKVVIYSATDATAAGPILKDFQKAFPKIQVEYNDLNSTELYSRLISEIAAGSGSGDLAWSSAMDLQIKLVQDGYTQPYTSVETDKLPGWAVYKNSAYGVTYEPIVFVHNKRLLPTEQMPKTHAALAPFLQQKKTELAGKVTTYDPERSGTGFVYLTHDLDNNPQLWDLAAGLGAVGVKLQTSTGTMLERIGSGEQVLGYNMIGSYALNRAKKDPNLGIVYPEDYILGVSRVLLIPKGARNINAAKVFLDFILSARGQKAVADAGLFSIRADVEGEATAKTLREKFGDRLKPIPVDDSVAKYLDQTKRLDFLKKWQEAMKAPK
jgi:iron(III) transport system substrate-binding protein